MRLTANATSMISVSYKVRKFGMIRTNNFTRKTFTLLLIASFIVWCVLPNINHVPRALETIQEHIDMIAEHGHSHNLVEDLLWAMHGHSHDEIDHDHSPAVLISSTHNFYMPHHKGWVPPRPKFISTPVFLIERPPRA